MGQSQTALLRLPVKDVDGYFNLRQILATQKQLYCMVPGCSSLKCGTGDMPPRCCAHITHSPKDMRNPQHLVDTLDKLNSYCHKSGQTPADVLLLIPEATSILALFDNLDLFKNKISTYVKCVGSSSVNGFVRILKYIKHDMKKTILQNLTNKQPPLLSPLLSKPMFKPSEEMVANIIEEVTEFVISIVLKSSKQQAADNLYWEYCAGLTVNKLSAYAPIFIKTYGCYLYKSDSSYEAFKSICDKDPAKHFGVITPLREYGLGTNHRSSSPSALSSVNLPFLHKSSTRDLDMSDYLSLVQAPLLPSNKSFSRSSGASPSYENIGSDYKSKRPFTNPTSSEYKILHDIVSACKTPLRYCVAVQSVPETSLTLKDYILQKASLKYVVHTSPPTEVVVFDILNPSGWQSITSMIGFIQMIYFGLAKFANNFTHYDLHNENVLIWPIPENKYVTVHYVNSHGSSEFSFRVKYLPFVIDYGRVYFNNDSTTINSLDIVKYITSNSDVLGEDIVTECSNSGFAAQLSETTSTPLHHHINPVKRNISSDLRLLANLDTFAIDSNLDQLPNVRAQFSNVMNLYQSVYFPRNHIRHIAHFLEIIDSVQYETTHSSPEIVPSSSNMPSPSSSFSSINHRISNVYEASAALNTLVQHPDFVLQNTNEISDNSTDKYGDLYMFIDSLKPYEFYANIPHSTTSATTTTTNITTKLPAIGIPQ